MKTKTVQLGIRLDEERAEKLKKLVEKDRRTKTEVVLIALDQYFAGRVIE